MWKDKGCISQEAAMDFLLFGMSPGHLLGCFGSIQISEGHQCLPIVLDHISYGRGIFHIIVSWKLSTPLTFWHISLSSPAWPWTYAPPASAPCFWNYRHENHTRVKLSSLDVKCNLPHFPVKVQSSLMTINCRNI